MAAWWLPYIYKSGHPYFTGLIAEAILLLFFTLNIKSGSGETREVSGHLVPNSVMDID